MQRVEGVVTCAGVRLAAEGAGVPVLPVLVPEEEVLGVAPGEALRAHHAARHPAQLSVLPALDNTIELSTNLREVAHCLVKVPIENLLRHNAKCDIGTLARKNHK